MVLLHSTTDNYGAPSRQKVTDKNMNQEEFEKEALRIAYSVGAPFATDVSLIRYANSIRDLVLKDLRRAAYNIRRTRPAMPQVRR